MDLLNEGALKDKKEVILESGCSLSEQAHELDVAPTCTPHINTIEEEEKGEESSPSSSSALAYANTSIIGGASIQRLRQRVVDDVIGHPASANAVDDNNQVAGQSLGKVVCPIEFEAGKPVVLPMVYCDFTASHQPLMSIESYLTKQCLPMYGNTHTNTSVTGSQSTAFCSEARQIVGEFCGAKTTGKASQDVVLFAGNGTTAAVELLIDCLGLKHHILHRNASSDDDTKPVVFIGPTEHHSNILPWRELGQVDIEMVRLDPSTGNVDILHLKALLEKYATRKVKIGAFSAASNVTGVIADDITITALLHQYGALSVWDYATGASYLDVQMNPRHPDYSHAPELLAKDAIVFSGHKLLGGVGTPGVLVIKKHLVSQQNSPSRSGGGTVFYVTADHHRFLSNRIQRYEGGTPNIVGIWRLGLALTAKVQLKKQFECVATKQSIPIIHPGTNALLNYDLERAKKIQHRLAQIPNLALLDESYSHNESYSKLPVFSFLIKCGTRFLHYNYVSALLNDVFGIQSRGGCQCAGPFSQYLLGLHGEINEALEECLVHTKDELLRPGFTRLSLPTLGTTEDREEYVIKAIAWVAQNGWRFMHVYRCNHRTGEWRHKSRPGAPLGKLQRKWLSHYRNEAFNPSSTTKKDQNGEVESVPTLDEAFNIANELLQHVVQDNSSLMQAVKMSQETDEDSSTLSALRWYVYPKEVAVFLQQGLDEVPGTRDRNNIVGAVRPVTWFPVIHDPSTTHVSDNRSKDVILDAPTAISSEAETPNFPSTIESKTASIPDNKYKDWLSFQDGEHSGQAPIDEIIAGYEEGELSADCLIYNIESDEWEKIDIYLARQPAQVEHPPQDATTAVSSAIPAFDDDDHEEPPPSDPLPNASSEPVSISLSDLPMIEKNTKKKPQRDSAAWGQGTMVPIHAPTTTAATTEGAHKPKRHKHIKPPPKLMRLVTQAMIQWDMVEEGDKLLLGLSGGKDSLTLLHILLEFQKKLPIKFEIEVCTIDPMTPSFDPSPLIPYVESLGLKYHYIRDDIVERANRAGKDGKVVSSLCSYCARMKRGHLYACARKNNCNKLVLAQHLDDLAESFMMSVMHNGFLRTMKANYKINAGDLSVIRPLVYCRESLTAEFARTHLQGLLVNENCPACFEEPKERARIKKLLSKEETLYPNFYDNIKRSLLPLMHDDATAILRSYTEEALDKSRKETHKKFRPRGGEEEKKDNHAENTLAEVESTLASFSDDELVKELARRRAASFRLAGAMKRTGDEDDDVDPTGQVCSLNGGNGTIPCRELME